MAKTKKGIVKKAIKDSARMETKGESESKKEEAKEGEGEESISSKYKNLKK